MTLAAPIQAQRLRERNLTGKRVVIVVDDHARPTPVAGFIGPVLDELAIAGVKDADLDVLVATGVHRASRPEEVKTKIGPEAFSRLRWRCHNAHDPGELADMGVTRRGTRVFLNRLLTQADLIVCLSAVEPHLLVGFGGGLKIIIPGCAGAETIGRNHLQGADPNRFDLVGVEAEESMMRLDLEEGAQLLGKDFFIINTAMNERCRPTRFFCGHPIAAHRAGTAFIRNLVGLEVQEQADVVIANSLPMDSDLRQSFKSLGNTLYACREGGVMMAPARCEQGLGELPVSKRTMPYPLKRTLLKAVGKHRLLPIIERLKKTGPWRRFL